MSTKIKDLNPHHELYELLSELLNRIEALEKWKHDHPEQIEWQR